MNKLKTASFLIALLFLMQYLPFAEPAAEAIEHTGRTALAVETAEDSGFAVTELKLLRNGDLVSVSFPADREREYSPEKFMLYGIVKSGIAGLSEEADISNAAYRDIGELTADLQDIINSEPLWNKIESRVRVYTDADGLITALGFDYSVALRKSMALSFAPSENDGFTLKQGIAHALASVSSEMSDLEKALALHDYLVREVDYDLGYFTDGINIESYSMGGTLMNRIAVCSGYAETYAYLLQQEGISSYVLASNPMNHAWNLVQIDGDWYHVDCTWDDPVNYDSAEIGVCRGGYGEHGYFMISDTEFPDNDHYDWYLQSEAMEVPAASVNNSFENYAFRGAPLMSYSDGYWYALNDVFYGDQIIKSKIDGSSKTTVNLGKHYRYMFMLGGKLYANTKTLVTEFGTDLAPIRTVSENAEIQNFWLKRDKLQCWDSEDNLVTIPIEAPSVFIDSGAFKYIIMDAGSSPYLLLYDYTGSGGAITLPASVSGYPVKHIGAKAFSDNTGLTGITIPVGITRIGANAFDTCENLESVTIPNSVTSIGDYAFSWCNSLRSLTIPDSVTSIGDYAFSWCANLGSMAIPEGVTSIGYRLFSGCSSLTSITLPDGLKSIDEYAFYDCYSLESIDIPDGVTSIGDYAFGWCNALESITIPAGVKRIGYYAFCNCIGLESITLSVGLNSIEDYAFAWCGYLTSAVLPAGMTTVGSSAFSGCWNMETITIPATVTSIGSEAFYECESLTIRGYSGSVAQQYAADNSIAFEIIGGNTAKGDFDGDERLTVSDALAALRIAARLVAVTPETLAIGDTDGDGSITVSDALAILRVAARLSAGL